VSTYQQFLASKAQLSQSSGFEVAPEEINPWLKPFNRDIVRWALHGGRRAIFAAFGLHKTAMQLEIGRLVSQKTGGKFLIVAPLGVRQEFKRDAKKLGIEIRFIKKTEEVLNGNGQAENRIQIREASANDAANAADSGAQGENLQTGRSGNARSFAVSGPASLQREGEVHKTTSLRAGTVGEDGGDAAPIIYLTNYESVRDGKLDVSHFSGVSLDEASILRGFGGSKTFREFMRLFEGKSTYRFVATATPSPNEFIELLAYAAFLDVMDVGQAKTRFFKRNSTNADDLTLHPHKEREFWLWVSSWAIFLQRPSDLGYSDEGYDLPELDIHWHEINTSHDNAGAERSGQGRLLKNAALGLQDAAREKRESLPLRIAKLMQLAAEADAELPLGKDILDSRVTPTTSLAGSEHSRTDGEPRVAGCVQRDTGQRVGRSQKGKGSTQGADRRESQVCNSRPHFIVWHDLEAERKAIEEALPEAVSVYGSQDLDEREKAIIAFSDGEIPVLAAKPVIAGSGCNFQRHCWWEIFLGIGYKFNDFIQAVHRCQRFGQEHRVRLDLIYTEAEREIRRELERKWAQHVEVTAQMTAIIREYGLASNAIANEMQRGIGCERQVEEGEHFTAVNNDTVLETARMDADSVHLIVTSIPFSTQYEYTPSYNDFGHTDSNDHFFEQMDFLIPELLRVLQPGRVAAIHVKDRIVPGGLTGLGFQTVYPFSDQTIRNFTKHGFAFLGRKTIVTDVVRENNQTYRLGWTEQCKDGSRMGAGMPEYLLLFRKPPTDSSNGYADFPVVKDKEKYSRSRWQVDAHGYMRSSGNRLLSVHDLKGMKHEKIFKMFREHSRTQVYDFEHHVALGEALEADGLLPVTFMLLQPQSWHSDVWTDITRMRTLNGLQHAKGKEMHLCPLQFDIVDRVITQFSMTFEKVYDPFAGLMTVPYCAVKLGRYGIGTELNPGYFRDGVAYCRSAEAQQNAPTLFDLAAEELEEVAANA
jgi:DNA modification methylase